MSVYTDGVHLVAEYPNICKTMTVGSLFSGVGGFDLGLEMAGMRVKWQVEIDDYATKILEKHWPDVRRYRDIRDCGKHNLEPVDLICGGDPCQRNSNAWRHGDGKTSLGGEFIRVVDEMRPRLVLRENPSRVRKDAPWPWWRFSRELERLGYAVLPLRLRACCAGANHQRERLFLLAEFQDAHRSGLERHECEKLAREIERGQNPDFTGPDQWSATPRICRGIDGVPHRVDRLRCLGNAVVPQVAQVIGEIIMRFERERFMDRQRERTSI